ncbi:PaaI family thioesterase [Vineibacter terrae]|uniref:PaaI family thioesterase n=1 Tax=Vineibacter terrae TaxID=2586908 RepID=UPI002E375263|nr:PaaI family thioesterase [Vineibacter terrae]HEX2888216.1 PaaI family thioesterase [Vineibacter terrae]
MTDEEILHRFNTYPQPASTTLGAEVLDIDTSAGKVTLRCTATREHCHSVDWNPKGGIVQGGFVTGWLDAAMATACIARAKFAVSVPSLEIKVSFLAPAHPGIYLAKGWIQRWGRTIAFLEGDLRDTTGKLIATASSTAMLAPLPATANANAA